MSSTNILMLQTVANGLGELKDEMVFVGGAVAELYADNPAASEIRPTIDVDCVIEISSRLQFARLEENLRARGFKNDTSEGAPICTIPGVEMIYGKVTISRISFTFWIIALIYWTISVHQIQVSKCI